MSKTYSISTIGCQMNEADSRYIAAQLEALGFTPHAGSGWAGDLALLNTCVVRQQAEDKAVNYLHRLRHEKKRRPEMMVALMGCMVGLREQPALKKRFPFVDVFLPPSDTGPLLDYLAAQGIGCEAHSFDLREQAIRAAVQDEEFALPMALRGQIVTANVPVVLGCSHACSFCIIPYRRGAERSRRPDEIIEEIQRLTRQGVREVMLLGQIIDRYGMDFKDDTNLAGLLRRVATLPGIERVRFLTSHPNWMSDHLIDTVADTEKICPQIEIPVQAGNDEVLERMRRGYTVDDYRRVIDRIRTRIPDAAIHTDIIVGFCGETDRQFKDTMRLTEEVQWDKMHLAKYSVRPHTLAARRYPDDVPPEEKEARRNALDELQTRILKKKNEHFLGTTVEVLVEHRHKGKWKGRTPHNKLVFFEDDLDRAGQCVPVQIEHTTPYTLTGSVIRSHNSSNT